MDHHKMGHRSCCEYRNCHCRVKRRQPTTRRTTMKDCHTSSRRDWPNFHTHCNCRRQCRRTQRMQYTTKRWEENERERERARKHKQGYHIKISLVSCKRKLLYTRLLQIPPLISFFFETAATLFPYGNSSSIR